ncbi:hypothetical protein L1987_61857 [Smallanthus sonchifolius]|uniref:Uncharacterized protein n=1 Tax=Smallanthus sonchifolius TaxID=185202 RepID=A0ACB9C8S3_9ASTR|nr:hypothetical protein L1987_61857 [Smallanthus sonchifolius]
MYYFICIEYQSILLYSLIPVFTLQTHIRVSYFPHTIVHLPFPLLVIQRERDPICLTGEETERGGGGAVTTGYSLTNLP